MSAMQHDVVVPLTDAPLRLSGLGRAVIEEICVRTHASKEVVLRAMLLTSLEHQRALMANIEKLRGHEGELDG